MPTKTRKGKIRSILLQEFTTEGVLGSKQQTMVFRHNDLWCDQEFREADDEDEYYVIDKNSALHMRGPYTKGELLDQYGILVTI